MAFTINDLFEGSFRGIPFLIMGEQPIEKGNKLVVSSPVNSNDTTAEPLGKKTTKFTINAVLTGDYKANQSALEQALNDPSIGILFHPFEGSKNVQCETFNNSQDIGNIGTITYSIQFIETVELINPKQTGNIVSNIENKIDGIDTLLQNELAEGFKVSNIYPENFNDSKASINQICDSMDQFKGSLGSGLDTSNFDFSNNQLRNNPTANIKNPTLFASSISDVFSEANTISDDPILTGNAFISIFNFADIQSEVPTIPTLSQQASERIQNRQTINYLFNLYALIYAYLNFSQATFTDTNQLNEVFILLESQYQKIMNGRVTQGEAINIFNILNFETIDEIENLRSLVRIQFNKDNNNSEDIIAIQVNNNISATLLSYSYYQTTDQTQSIIDLNDLKNASFVKGEINIRTVSV